MRTSDWCDCDTVDWHDSIVTLSTCVTPLTGITCATINIYDTTDWHDSINWCDTVTPPETRAHSLNEPVFKRVNGITISNGVSAV